MNISGKGKSKTSALDKSSLRKSVGNNRLFDALRTPIKSKAKADTESTSDKTIQHLRTCLERERRKVVELGKIVTQVQNRNSSINDAIIEAMEETKGQGGDKVIESLLKSEKLFQAIRDLKKRLSMCEKPSIQCGWG